MSGFFKKIFLKIIYKFLSFKKNKVNNCLVDINKKINFNYSDLKESEFYKIQASINPVTRTRYNKKGEYIKPSATYYKAKINPEYTIKLRFNSEEFYKYNKSKINNELNKSNYLMNKYRKTIKNIQNIEKIAKKIQVSKENFYKARILREKRIKNNICTIL